MAAERVRDGGITVELSHPGKVLFPDDGFTKRDLVEYFAALDIQKQLLILPDLQVLNRLVYWLKS